MDLNDPNSSLITVSYCTQSLGKYSAQKFIKLSNIYGIIGMSDFESDSHGIKLLEEKIRSDSFRIKNTKRIQTNMSVYCDKPFLRWITNISLKSSHK